MKVRFAAAMTAAMLAMLAAPVLAQTPAPPAPKAPATPQAQPKAQPKAGTQPAPATAAAPGAPEVPPLTFTPWTKVCIKQQEANQQQVCFTGKDGRIDNGMLVIGATLIEPEGAPTKLLRVTLPLGVQLAQGTRVIVDQGQPLNAPYTMCFPNGCMADYEVSTELLTKLRKGQSMVVQGIGSQNQLISLPVPLSDFGKAYDGPPTDPKVIEERQKKMQDELQKKFEQQQQQQAPK
jgi:invasion protein IalB